MAHINLLPWREQLRAKRQREFMFALVGGAVIACLLVALVHLRLQGIINAQEHRNQFLSDAIAELDISIEKIKDLESTKNKLLARMNIIQELQRNRPLSVHLADELVRTLPEGVYLSEIIQEEDKLTMSGIAQSNARVSAYMRNIDASDWLHEPALGVIKTNEVKGQRIATFTLRAAQKSTMRNTNTTYSAGGADATPGT
ncbi:MAG: PilN domain-containing protein [Gammaproteobacteria bacterium]